MAQITYIEHSGTRHVIEVANGHSVMDGAISNSVPGIVADCGGACACATCHVYVDPEWMSVVGPASELEAAMLTVVETPKPESRLSCQISVTDAMNGLVVNLPENQG
jgi:ferredoxin, 2Fe-2S